MDTIRNINLIGRIHNETKTLLEQIVRAENTGCKVYALDVEVMLAKTRRVYESLLLLETEKQETEIALPQPIFEVNEPSQHEVFSPMTEEKLQDHEEDTAHEPPLIEQTFEIEESTPPKTERFDYEPPTFKPKEEKEPLYVHKVEEASYKQDQTSQETELASHKHSFKSEKTHAGRTTFDLFGETETGTIADKLTALANGESSEDNTIAARIGKSKINDLKQAIGINEKFLLINELFEGNISLYNKAIDELNGFQSLNGAKTYLIELSVQYQWAHDAVAVEKITSLIERKFEA
ncbi:MAG: hypothetical protein CVT92_03980 [Bacteroidetes bacterium HGW-Bacteroidetes-1]|jgi:hypothetical protein|nr:MAG: hypothetical protein CVT92_03980 [Bacteroidetes bacterium HGW-Bacteroidetes-1]